MCLITRVVIPRTICIHVNASGGVATIWLTRGPFGEVTNGAGRIPEPSISCIYTTQAQPECAVGIYQLERKWCMLKAPPIIPLTIFFLLINAIVGTIMHE